MKRDISLPEWHTVFRATALLQWALLTAVLCLTALEPPPAPDLLTGGLWLYTSLLVALLLPRGLGRRLAKAYLPLLLALATLGPVAAYGAAMGARILAGLAGEAAWVDSGAQILLLVVPLLLVSSQYSLAAMLLFNFGSGLLELALAGVLQVLGGPPVTLALEAVLIRVVLFTLVGAVVVRLSGAQRAQAQALAQQNARLAEFAAAQERLAVSRERVRLSRDLHDTLAHTLTAITVQLQALGTELESDPPAARARLDKLEESARQGLQETRLALKALRASPLEDLGLLLALRQLAEGGASRAGMALALDLPESAPPLDAAAAQHLYRIAEEAVNNAVHHAGARNLTLSLAQVEGAWQLAVADDGQGFDPAALPEGRYGLAGMRERAALMGAELALHSQPGSGTRLEVTLKEGA